MTQYIYGYSNDTKNVYEKLMSIIQEHVLQGMPSRASRNR